ncbi:MAG: glycosyl hydrolase, partial [Gemmatimonadota bacterium]
GRTWTRIVNGIRGDAYVHAVREDPTRQGLLYAATQHGVYISYDDGARWQELTPALPDLPIVDLIVEKNELVITAHGRGFWILDNLAPIRQAAPNFTTRPVTLFRPPAAYRSANGVTLSWWLAQAPKEARLEILDPSGTVVRTFLSADSTRERDRWAGPSLPTKAGLNYIQWDLATTPAVTFPGMILWGVRTLSPVVPPGQYQVRLTADGRSETTSVEVRRHPWITDVTDEDLQAQYQFGQQIRDKVNEANGAVVAIRSVKTQLAARLKESSDPALAAAAKTLEDHASEIEAQIYQVKNRSNQDPLNFPIRVNNRLANLLSMSEAGDGRPGNGMEAVFQIMVTELKRYTDRLAEVWATDLAAVNRELARLRLAPIDRMAP